MPELSPSITKVTPLKKSTSFVFPKGLNVYDNSGRVDIKTLAEKTYRGLCAYLKDDREYVSASLTAYLSSNKAEEIERHQSIEEESTTEDHDGLDILMGYEGSYTHSVYFYKGVFIRIGSAKNASTIELSGSMKHDLDVVHAEFSPFIAPRKRAAVSILLQTPHGLTTKSIDFEPPVIDDLALNYGVAFPDIDKQIVKKLESGKAGLMCFHGCPGVGKTSYIKHLTSRINREFIFIPVGMAGELASPAFLSLLLNHERAILVMEDAEQALQSRETDHWNSSTIATLLNLSDGILGNLLNITIIATYNADRQMIDKALLRKGRLSFDYTFDNLPVEDARRLAVHLGKDPSQFTGPTSLADIYNAEDNTGYVPPVVKSMGFGFGAALPQSTPKS